MTPELPDRDLAAIADYVDGRLDDDGMMELELRLADDEELAAATRELALLDHLQRAALVGRPAPAAPVLRLPVVRAALAVAASLLVAAAAWWLWPRQPDFRCETALLASANTLREAHVRLGLSPSQMPGGYDFRSDGAAVSAPPIPGREYLALVEPLLRREAEAALAGAATTLASGHFLVPLRATRECSALVVCLAGDGLLVPPLGEGDLVWSAPRRLEPDVTHRLPGERVVLAPSPTGGDLVEYRAGFLVPIGAGRLDVVLAVRDEPFGDDVLAALAARVAALRGGLASSEGADGTPGAGGDTGPDIDGADAAGRSSPRAVVTRGLCSWLEEKDFDVSLFQVMEP